MADDNIDFINNLKNLNPGLNNYGFSLLSYLIGEEVSEIKKALDSNDAKQMSQVYSKYVFNSNMRSFFLHRIQNLDVLDEYSHLYHLGLIHFFRNEFVSSQILLTTYLEGTFRKLINIPIGVNTGYNEITDKVCDFFKDSKIIYTSFDMRYYLFIESLRRLLTNFYSNFSSQGNDICNRHSIIHALDPKNYSYNNVIRLICIIDLICELQTIRTGKEYYPFIDKFVNDENSNYFQKLFTNFLERGDFIEIDLLRKNKNYVWPDIR